MICFFSRQDGGVFTCGAGMYGQLGHGSFSNEIVPRKVIELMGSTVTQVTCGRYLFFKTILKLFSKFKIA